MVSSRRITMMSPFLYSIVSLPKKRSRPSLAKRRIVFVRADSGSLAGASACVEFGGVLIAYTVQGIVLDRQKLYVSGSIGILRPVLPPQGVGNDKEAKNHKARK